MKIGDKIKLIREKERNFNQKSIADIIGINLRSYQNIENNVSDITFNRLEQVAKALEVTTTYIINYGENKGSFSNQFNNYEGNKGTNIMHQGNDIDTIHKMYTQMLAMKDEIIADKKRLY
jgi:transcriptional regulator with XRE-family HTH domain